MIRKYDSILAIAILVSLVLAIMGSITGTNTIAYSVPIFNFGLLVIVVSSTLYWTKLTTIDEVAYLPVAAGVGIALLLVAVSLDTIWFSEWQGANNTVTIIVAMFYYFGTVILDVIIKKLKK